jgi:hypothetical protein
MITGPPAQVVTLYIHPAGGGPQLVHDQQSTAPATATKNGNVYTITGTAGNNNQTAKPFEIDVACP